MQVACSHHLPHCQQGLTTYTVRLLIGTFIAVPIVALLCSILYYIADVHRLRRFPTPSLSAALSPFWMMWHNAHGQKYLALDMAHQKLGPVLRVGPKTLSFSAPEAYKDIYGHANNNPSMGDATDRQLHSIKRKNLSSIFSAKNILSMEPKVTSSVKELLAAIHIKLHGGALSKRDKHVVLEGVLDIQPWLNMFSYDVISKMLWSSSYGFLKCGSDDCKSMSGDGRVVTVPAIRCFQAGVQFNALCAHLPPPLYRISRFVTKPMYRTAAADHFSGMARYGIIKRMERGDSDDKDFFSFFPTQKTKNCPIPMELPELIAECGTFLNAGNDTIQISLTNTIYELASHPECQQKLYNLLTESLPKQSQPIASYMELSKIPFLAAVLDETFRLLPPVRFNLPRIIVQNGAVIAGHHILAGVTVSSSVYIMHRDEKLFRKSLEWLPERWLPEHPDFSETERRNLKDFVLPFTLGGRACIGRNLAYMELSVCVAALVMAFEWDISEDDRVKFGHWESINCTPRELKVTARPRSAN
ncbi:cytochrome P450 [Trichoderma barbatum]